LVRETIPCAPGKWREGQVTGRGRRQVKDLPEVLLVLGIKTGILDGDRLLSFEL
jgi:hypothetical protein